MISKTGGYSRATVPCRNGNAVTYGRKVLNTLNSSRLHKSAQHVNGPAQISRLCFPQLHGSKQFTLSKTVPENKTKDTCKKYMSMAFFWTLFYHITTKFMKSNVCITIHRIHKNGSRAEEVSSELSATWSRGILGY